MGLSFQIYTEYTPSLLSHLSKDMNYLKLHNLHPYHAKFYPGIPLYFLQKYATATSLVLDPFCGSGTTLLECNAQCIDSIGIDINFLSAKISRAKTNIYDKYQIENLSQTFLMLLIILLLYLRILMFGLPKTTIWIYVSYSMQSKNRR